MTPSNARGTEVFAVFAFVLRSDWGERSPVWPTPVDGEAEPTFLPLGDGGIAAAAQRVDAAEYTGDRGTSQLQDLAWLVPRAEYHQRVVAAVGVDAAVVPVRFGTLFSDVSALEAWLAPRRAELASALSYLRGRSEWAVRLLAAPAPTPAAASAPRPGGEPSGRSYLLARKKVRDRQSGWRAEIEAVADRAEAFLASASIDLARLPVRSLDGSLREAQGDARRTAATWAALIETADAAGFRDRLEGMRRSLPEDRFDLEVTGPWPPYNFCPGLDRESKPGPDQDPVAEAQRRS